MTVTRPLRALALLGIAALIATALAFAGPQNAAAAPNQISIMMDDEQLVTGPRVDKTRDHALKTMKRLGVDVIRVTILWDYVASGAKTGKRQKKRFKADNPRTYPRANWDRYDRLVQDAAKHGLRVYFNITGPGPAWAHKRTKIRKAKRTFKPRAREFYKFVKAVATRYNGTYKDENDGRFRLGKVDFWSLWNEPNQGGWLSPQYEQSKQLGRVIPVSPIIYRELYLYGYKGLRDAGALKAGVVVLVGETAPLGTDRTDITSAMRPGLFLRELFCIDSAGNPYVGAEAEARKCSMFDRFPGGKLEASAWAHHPYTKKLAPTQADPHPDSITMANVGALGAMLDGAAARTGRLRTGMNTIMTEYGYETNPPDPYNGVGLAEQALYLNVGDWLAYRDPRVLGQAQFLLRDNPPVKKASPTSRRYWFTYQSGIFNADGSPKPAASAYLFPFIAYPSGQDADGRAIITLWGQLRFLDNKIAKGQKATVQFRVQGGTEWTSVGQLEAENGVGFLNGTATAPGPGSWRLVFGDPAKPAFVSREALIG